MRQGFLLVFALVLGTMAWVGSNNLWIGVAFLMLGIVDGVFFLDKQIETQTSRNLKQHECFQFINSFIIALSVKKTLSTAYQTVFDQTSGPLKEEMGAIQQVNSSEALECLSTYFAFPVYGLFLNVIHLYEEQGGDILVMGEFLIHEIRRLEEKLTLSEKMILRKWMNFLILWMMTLIILLFCRFGITGFYLQMLENPIFVSMILIFFAFMLFSVHVFFRLSLPKKGN